jgi:hypothetical protein
LQAHFVAAGKMSFLGETLLMKSKFDPAFRGGKFIDARGILAGDGR